MKLTSPIQEIKGIGEKKAKLFARLQIKTVEQLLYHFPARYEDRRLFKRFDEISHDERVCSSGIIVGFEKTTPKRNMTILKISVRQEHSVASLVIFNNLYILDKFFVGDRISFYGKAKKAFHHLEFLSVELEHYGENRLTGGIFPIYPLTTGLTNTDVQKAVRSALENCDLSEAENIPKELRSQRQLAPIDKAFQSIHFPQSEKSLQVARYRFVYQDFFALQLYILLMRSLGKEQEAIRLKPFAELEDFVGGLDFELTQAQKKVLADIRSDLQNPYPMQRLVQGDVGSGKTVIAFYCAYMTFLNHHQTALMVPTEILAKQHYHTALKIFEKTPLRIRLLVGSMTKKEKRKIYEEIMNHECDLVIGTHALIEEQVRFASLALTITDEQHRFGVRQRNALYSGYERMPHILVLTATPIPRTLALILQGDLDISIIDELPKGRMPIHTMVLPQALKSKGYGRCISELEKGRQVYVVCPLIEENAELDLQSAEELYDRLRQNEFRNYKVGIIHGSLKASEKNRIMKAFEEKEIHVLVSTTVIEVGINVPNATVMLIEEAQRFGLSQLHQLRGRVGRGSEQSYCILLYKGDTDILKQRMKIMSETSDGFLIAEKDLELRGPGEMFGLKQHGLPEFKIADLAKHLHIMEIAQRDAMSIIDGELLTKSERNRLLDRIKKRLEKQMEEIALN